MATATSVDEKDWDEDGVVRAKISTFSTLHSPTATYQVLLKRGVTVSKNNFTTSNGTILKSSLLESPIYSVKLKKLF